MQSMGPLNTKFRLSRNLYEHYSVQGNINVICLIRTTSNTNMANTQTSEVGASLATLNLRF